MGMFSSDEKYNVEQVNDYFNQRDTLKKYIAKEKNKEKKQLLYNKQALLYAENNGIITYTVKSNKMIYYKNVKNHQFDGRKWCDNPCTYKNTVNLDTFEFTTKKLKRLRKEGWDNT